MRIKEGVGLVPQVWLARYRPAPKPAPSFLPSLSLFPLLGHISLSARSFRYFSRSEMAFEGTVDEGECSVETMKSFVDEYVCFRLEIDETYIVSGFCMICR